jgi:hypothetical protein
VIPVDGSRGPVEVVEWNDHTGAVRTADGETLYRFTFRPSLPAQLWPPLVDAVDHFRGGFPQPVRVQDVGHVAFASAWEWNEATHQIRVVERDRTSFALADGLPPFPQPRVVEPADYEPLDASDWPPVPEPGYDSISEG